MSGCTIRIGSAYRLRGTSKYSRDPQGMSSVDENNTSPFEGPLLISIAKAYIAVEALWAASNTSIKISIMHFYITIFRSNKTFLKFAYAVMCFVSAFGVAVIIEDVLSCRPLSKSWDPLQAGVCEDIMKTLIANSSCNMAIDFIIILLPMSMLWRLQMATYRKTELTILFALGFM